jgi:deoxycytidylate deaminase
MMWMFMLYFVLFTGISLYVTMNSKKLLKIDMSREVAIGVSIVIGLAFGMLFQSFFRRENYDEKDKMIGYDQVDYVHAYANTIVDRAVKSIKIPNQEVDINPKPCEMVGRTWLNDGLPVDSVDMAVVDVESQKKILSMRREHNAKMTEIQASHEEMMRKLQAEHEARILALKTPQDISKAQTEHNAKMNEIQNAHVDKMMQLQREHDQSVVKAASSTTKEGFELPGEIRENREFDSGCQKCGVPMPYTTWQDFWKSGCM